MTLKQLLQQLRAFPKGEDAATADFIAAIADGEILEVRQLGSRGFGIVFEAPYADPVLLSRLEETIATMLDIQEVILGAKVTSDSPVLNLKDFEPWIKKHAEKQMCLETRMVLQGSIIDEAMPRRLAWQLPAQQLQMVKGFDGQDWLSRFWRTYGPYDLPVAFLKIAGTVAPSEEEILKKAAERLAAATKALQEQHPAQADDAPLEACETDLPLPMEKEKPERKQKTLKRRGDVLHGKPRNYPETPIERLHRDSDRVRIQGTVHDMDVKRTKNKAFLLIFAIRDLTGALNCTLFLKNEEKVDWLVKELKSGTYYFDCEVSYDERYEQDLVGRVYAIQEAPPFPERVDTEEDKRVELHAKTKMSMKDAIPSAKELVAKAAKFGHPAVAITDFGVVQAFPEAAAARKQLARDGQDIQILYGMEAEIIDDGQAVVLGVGSPEDYDLSRGFVALDLETTGLDCVNDRIIELAAILYEPSEEGRQFVEKDRWEGLFNPGVSLPPKIVELTGITDMELINKPMFHEKIHELADFIDGRPLLGHNVTFDLGFIRQAAYLNPVEEPRVKFNMPIIDTLLYARAALPMLRRFGLAHVAKELDVEQLEHHRAGDDARVSAEIFMRLWQRESVDTLAELNHRYGQLPFERLKNAPTYTATLLVRSELGMYSLYRMVSEAHLRYFYQTPRIPRSLLEYYRNGLYVGSGAASGKLPTDVLNLFKSYAGNYERAKEAILTHAEFRKLAREYDFIEVQPDNTNRRLLREANTPLKDEEDLKNFNRLLVDLAEKYGIPACATSNAHYLEPEDAIYRSVLLSDRGDLDADLADNLFFRTTDEMLYEFRYLGEELAKRIVLDNPKQIAAGCQKDLEPVPPGFYPPLIATAEDDVKRLVMEEAHRLYGKDGKLPELIEKRVQKELDAIISNGYAVMYIIAHELVKKSNEDGFVVGSRGSVGSSLVATLMNITEVNPLPPHYLCPQCHYFEADDSGEYGSGYDLPPKNCPDCGTPMQTEGQDIPFETFLGFDGNKLPDIDLNFSGLYQARAHEFIETMFGSEHSFRAGTISGFAEKNSHAIAKKYLEERGKRQGRAEVSRLAERIQGIKVTTGQHPGGIIVIPKEREIYDFTPIQHPANKQTDIITTHLDFNALHETILKLDILGHDDPTVLKLCQDMTDIEIKDVPVPEEKVMSLFQSTEALGIPKEESAIGSATIGLPEVGTIMARDMAEETNPTRFYDLIQLSGLAHGSDVWAGNAQELIRKGICTLNDVIGCRDSIMTRLIYDGLENRLAFDIMERVRKGRPLLQEQERALEENPNIPDWYIASCKKIKYMFPKAHAVAYTISALRIAWFKVYEPEAYYSASFTIREQEFSSENLFIPFEEIQKQRAEKRKHFYRLDEMEPQGKKKFYLLELVEEMLQRGLKFSPVSLEESLGAQFTSLRKGEIIPPFSVIPGISAAMGKAIVEARADGPFKNREEFRERCGLGQVAMEQLTEAGVLDGLPLSDQVDFFDLM